MNTVKHFRLFLGVKRSWKATLLPRNININVSYLEISINESLLKGTKISKNLRSAVVKNRLHHCVNADSLVLDCVLNKTIFPFKGKELSNGIFCLQ